MGSSNTLCDGSGGFFNREEYYPFGETSFGSYGKKRYRFCGKERDEESGMYYYGARYYLSWTCRFVSVDPKAQAYPWSSYVYAGNNPVMLNDVNGEGPGGDSSSPKGDGILLPEIVVNGYSHASLHGLSPGSQNLIYRQQQQLYDLRGPSGTTSTASNRGSVQKNIADSNAKIAESKRRKTVQKYNTPKTIETVHDAYKDGMVKGAYSVGDGLKNLLKLNTYYKLGTLYLNALNAELQAISHPITTLQNVSNSTINFVTNTLPNMSRNDIARGAGFIIVNIGFGAATGGAGEVGEAAELAEASADIGTGLISAEDRAIQLHALLKAHTASTTTTAVTETKQGIRIITSSEAYLRKEIKVALLPGEVVGTARGAMHAEIRGIFSAREFGLTPTGVAASRPICSNCQEMIKLEGIPPLSPLK